ncbi:MAG: hypothetical protein GY936_14945 [Ignavibacteriae bacterium]|nr:hypothetical protein [Ignavibacteriota bacterium]
MRSSKKYFNMSLFLTAILVFTVNTYSQTADDSDAKNLPLPSVLFEKHIEAIGGEKILRDYSRNTITGKLIIQAYGLNGKIQINAEAPNKMATTVDLGPLGQSRSGFNGSVGWSMDAMSGNKVLAGEALQAMITKSDFYANNLQLGKGATKKKTVDIVTIDGSEQFRVFLLNDKGEESFLYFSKETGLLSGIDRMELGAAGIVPTKIRLSNYVELDGLKTVRRISSSQNGIETIIEISSLSYNELAENVFDLPSEIQALVND